MTAARRKAVQGEEQQCKDIGTGVLQVVQGGWRRRASDKDVARQRPGLFFVLGLGETLKPSG